MSSWLYLYSKIKNKAQSLSIATKQITLKLQHQKTTNLYYLTKFLKVGNLGMAQLVGARLRVCHEIGVKLSVRAAVSSEASTGGRIHSQGYSWGCCQASVFPWLLLRLWFFIMWASHRLPEWLHNLLADAPPPASVICYSPQTTMTITLVQCGKEPHKCMNTRGWGGVTGDWLCGIGHLKDWLPCKT